MNNKALYLILGFFFFSFQAVAAPLCSILFSHDFSIDQFADVRHQGALDVGFDINKAWLLADKPLPEFQKPPVDAPARLSLDQIHFMQNNISNNFSDAKFTVVENARQIRDGKLDIEKFPAIRVWRDTSGKIWTLDHRRLISMILSGKIVSTKVEWAAEKLVKDQSSKMSTLDEGDSLVLTAKGKQSLFVERPGRKSIKPQFTKIRLKNVPRYGNKIVPPKVQQTSAVNNTDPQSQGKITEILFSTTMSLNESSIDLAHRLRAGTMKPESLPPLRVWVDSSGRTWTLDNDILAALRLADITGGIKTRLATAEELAAVEAVVDTQTGGRSYVIPLRDQGEAIVVR